MSAYRLTAPYDRQPLQRRLSGFALALGVNAGLLLILMSLGVIVRPADHKTLRGIVVTLLPDSRDSQPAHSVQAQRPRHETEQTKPLPKPPPITIPSKPTITPPPRQPPTKPAPWLELSKEEMASSDISKLSASGSGAAGDSEVVGTGPNGEALYAAQWAREPTDAELAGYIPRTSSEGFGLVACKTIPNDRVEDCVELDQTPGSRLASAVRQAAWQFRVRPPRKGGRALIGSWVRIRIDYSKSGSGD